MDNPPIPGRDYSQADQKVIELFKVYGLAVVPVVNVHTGQVAPPDEQFRNYDIPDTRWSFLIDAANNHYHYELFHLSQIDESDPTPILETWFPSVIAYIVADPVELETFTDMPPPDDDSEEG